MGKIVRDAVPVAVPGLVRRQRGGRGAREGRARRRWGEEERGGERGQRREWEERRGEEGKRRARRKQEKIRSQWCVRWLTRSASLEKRGVRWWGISAISSLEFEVQVCSSFIIVHQMIFSVQPLSLALSSFLALPSAMSPCSSRRLYYRVF